MSKKSMVFFYVLFIICGIIIWPYLAVIGFGATMAYLSEPAFDLACKKLKIKNKSRQWVLSTVGVILVVALFMFPIVYGVINGILQISNFVIENKDSLLSRLSDVQSSEIDSYLRRFHIPITFTEIAQRINDALVTGAQFIAKNIGVALQATPEAIVSSLVAVSAWVVFLMEGRNYREKLLPIVMPWQPERDLLCQTTSDVLKGVVLASILVSFVQAIIITILLLICQIPNTFLLGVLSFFASFVPIIGTAPILFGAAIYKYANGHIGWALFLCLSIMAVGTIDNLLRPYFIKGSVDLSLFWITIAFIGGVAIFGVAGAVIGPLFFALFVVYFERLDNIRKGKINS